MNEEHFQAVRFGQQNGCVIAYYDNDEIVLCRYRGKSKTVKASALVALIKRRGVGAAVLNGEINLGKIAKFNHRLKETAMNRVIGELRMSLRQN